MSVRRFVILRSSERLRPEKHAHARAVAGTSTSSSIHETFSEILASWVPVSGSPDVENIILIAKLRIDITKRQLT